MTFSSQLLCFLLGASLPVCTTAAVTHLLLSDPWRIQQWEFQLHGGQLKDLLTELRTPEAALILTLSW
jgi:hypothetical protein